MTTKLTTRDQKYAAVIYEQVVKVSAKDKDDYGRLANHLPVLVKKAGLAQALSFAEAKAESGDLQLLNDLQQAIRQISDQSNLDLRSESLTAALPKYLWLTQQVMTALHWYKRFAQSVLNVKQGDEGRKS